MESIRKRMKVKGSEKRLGKVLALREWNRGYRLSSLGQNKLGDKRIKGLVGISVKCVCWVGGNFSRCILSATGSP